MRADTFFRRFSRQEEKTFLREFLQPKKTKELFFFFKKNEVKVGC